jgi:hypothetical protein
MLVMGRYVAYWMCLVSLIMMFTISYAMQHRWCADDVVRDVVGLLAAK